MEGLLLLPLLKLIQSDFRERQVRVSVLLLFGGLQWGICLINMGTVLFVERIVENILLLAIWGLGILFCFWRRYFYRQTRKTGMVGKGDTFFLLCLLPVFPLREFLIFLLLSFGVALIYWVLKSKASLETIPLVSMVGICYLPVLILRLYGY